MKRFTITSGFICGSLWLVGCGGPCENSPRYHILVQDTPPRFDAGQIDRAWARATHVLVPRGHVAPPIVDLVVGPFRAEGVGPLLAGFTVEGGGYSRVALLNGRSAAAAHEFTHSILDQLGILDGDPDHTGPWWPQVNGDTPDTGYLNYTEVPCGK